MEVIVQENEAKYIADDRAEDAEDEVVMKLCYFWKSHEVFGKNEDGKGNSFELEIALLSENDKGKHHYDSSLEDRFPEPLEEVVKRQVLNLLKGMIQFRETQCIIELYNTRTTSISLSRISAKTGQKVKIVA